MKATIHTQRALVAFILLTLVVGLMPLASVAAQSGIFIAPASGPPGTPVSISNIGPYVINRCAANGIDFFSGGVIVVGGTTGYSVPLSATGQIIIECWTQGPDVGFVSVGQAVFTVDIQDTDGDGVPNHQDRCPAVPGLADLQGCPAVDTDGDGVPDNQDECPTVYGLPERNGCPAGDADNDGIPDDQDACPYVSGQGDQFGGVNGLDGCPVDSDGDGINDGLDYCPYNVGIESNGGCPMPEAETDTDGDGVIDSQDACPNEYGSASAGGCPLFEMPSTGPCLVASNYGTVNIRVGPSTSEAIAARLPGRSPVNVLGQTPMPDGTWYQIANGWVASYVTILGGDCSAVPVVGEDPPAPVNPVPDEPAPPEVNEPLFTPIDLSDEVGEALAACPDLATQAGFLPVFVQLDVLSGAMDDPCSYVQDILGELVFGGEGDALSDENAETILEDCPEVMPALLMMMDRLGALNTGAWSTLNAVMTPENACKIAQSIAAERLPAEFLDALMANPSVARSSSIRLKPRLAPLDRALYDTQWALCALPVTPETDSLFTFLSDMGITNGSFASEMNCSMLETIRIVHILWPLTPSLQAGLSYMQDTCSFSPLTAMEKTGDLFQANVNVIALLMNEGTNICDPNWWMTLELYNYLNPADDMGGLLVPASMVACPTIVRYLELVDNDLYTLWMLVNSPGACGMVSTILDPNATLMLPPGFEPPCMTVIPNASTMTLADGQTITNDSPWDHKISVLDRPDPCAGITLSEYFEDTDGDGVPDVDDVCPTTVGFGRNGCVTTNGIPTVAEDYWIRKAVPGGTTFVPLTITDPEGDHVTTWVGDTREHVSAVMFGDGQTVQIMVEPAACGGSACNGWVEILAADAAHQPVSYMIYFQITPPGEAAHYQPRNSSVDLDIGQSTQIPFIVSDPFDAAVGATLDLNPGCAGVANVSLLPLGMPLTGVMVNVQGVALGNCHFMLRLQDSGGDVDGVSITANIVAGANAPPFLYPAGHVQLLVGNTKEIIMTAYDPEGGVMTLSDVTCNAGPAPDVVSVLNDPTVMAVTLTGLEAGATGCTAEVTDDAGGKGYLVFEVLVTTNTSPTIAPIPDQTLRPGETIVLSVLNADIDPDMEPLSVWVDGYDGALVTVNTIPGPYSNAINIMAGPATGSTTAMLHAHDAYAGYATPFNIIVDAAANMPPTITPLLPFIMTDMGVYATNPVTFTDPDGDPITVGPIVSSNEDVAIAYWDNPGAPTEITVWPKGIGTTTLAISADDGLHATVIYLDVDIIPGINLPPTLLPISESTIPVGTTQVIEIDAFDPEGDAMTFQVFSDNPAIANPSLLGTTLSVQGVAVGDANVIVTVRDTVHADPNIYSATQVSFPVHIVSNGPPLIVPISTQHVPVGGELYVPVVATDPEGLEVILAANSVNPTVVSVAGIASSPTEDFVVINGLSVGETDIQVTGTDPTSMATTTSFHVVVSDPANLPPTVIWDGLTTLGVGDTIIALVHVTDPEGATPTVTLNVSSGASASVMFDGTNAVVTGVSTGVTHVVITANDGANVTTNTVPITVISAGGSPGSDPGSTPADEGGIDPIADFDLLPDLPMSSDKQIAAIFQALSDETGESFVFTLQGEAILELETSLDRSIFYPVIGPDGELILFLAEDDEGALTLFLYRPSVGLALPLLQSTDALEILMHPPAWSPEGDMILVTLLGGTETPGVYVIDISDPQNITTPVLLIPNARTAVYAPNGRYVAYEHPEPDGSSSIYVIAVNNPGRMLPVLETISGVVCSAPMFGLDSYSLFFACATSDGETQLYHYNVQGIQTVDMGVANPQNPVPGPVEGYLSFDDGSVIYFGQDDGSASAPLITLEGMTAGGLRWPTSADLEEASQ